MWPAQSTQDLTWSQIIRHWFEWLDAAPEKAHKSGSKWTILYIYIYTYIYRPVFLLCRYSHFASFRKQVAWLLWVAWCLTSAGLACKGDMVVPCQPARQPARPRFAAQSCDGVTGVKNLTQNCLISVLLFRETLLPLMTHQKCNKVCKARRGEVSVFLTLMIIFKQKCCIMSPPAKIQLK